MTVVAEQLFNCSGLLVYVQVEHQFTVSQLEIKGFAGLMVYVIV